MKRLGVLGGMGPLATAYFLELVVQMTEAKTDQKHIEMILYHCPTIPDRTGYMLGKTKESPLPVMEKIVRWLTGQGAEYLAIPCITAHFFYKELEKAAGIPIIHIVKEAAEYLSLFGIRKVGVMATDGTIGSGLFQEELHRWGIECILPDQKNQQYVMELIYQGVKAGKSIEIEKFYAVQQYLRQEGAECILLGCTELSLIKRDYSVLAGSLDVMEVLARKAVLFSGAKLKGEYQCLITDG